MVQSIPDHRARAADCIQRARATADENSKALFLSLAQLWMTLADEHVRLERFAEDQLNGDHSWR